MLKNDFVIDASIVAAYLLDESSNIADAVMGSLRQYKAIAPSFWSLEISNILLSAERRRRILPGTQSALAQKVECLEVIEEPYSQARIFSNILTMALFHGLSAYDATYLELASRLSVPLATLDKKLRSAAEAQGVSIFDGLKFV